MIDYKLVQLDGVRIVTGQELKDNLTGFAPLALAPRPKMPPEPIRGEDESLAQFDARYIAWFNGAYKEWQTVCNQRVYDCNAFEQVLRQMFQIASYTKTGRNLPDGRPEIDWCIKPILIPPYPSFAQKISGLKAKPKNIDWICFKTFYT